MAEVIADENGYIMWFPLVDKPSVPYWASIMAAAKFCEKVVVDEECSDNCIFVTKDGRVLAVQMLDPVDNAGAPIESVINFLRKHIPQQDIDELIESVIDVKGQIGLIDDASIKEFMEMMQMSGDE
jgi:hypothetical protein